MPVRHYIIAEGENREELMHQVFDYYQEGYRPYGNLTICFVPEHRLQDNTYVKEHYIYAQAMIKQGV